MGPHCKVGRYWNINSIINTIQAPESTAVLLPAGPSVFSNDISTCNSRLAFLSCLPSLLDSQIMSTPTICKLHSPPASEFAFENPTWHSCVIFICHVICKISDLGYVSVSMNSALLSTTRHWWKLRHSPRSGGWSIQEIYACIFCTTCLSKCLITKI